MGHVTITYIFISLYVLIFIIGLVYLYFNNKETEMTMTSNLEVWHNSETDEILIFNETYNWVMDKNKTITSSDKNNLVSQGYQKVGKL